MKLIFVITNWRNWYRYNYKIKQAICFYVDDAKEQNQFLNLIDAVGDAPSHTELLHHFTPGIFLEQARHLLIHVLQNLNLNELIYTDQCKVHSTVSTCTSCHNFDKISRGGGGGDNSTYYVMGTCHFARKIGTHYSVNSGGF